MTAYQVWHAAAREALAQGLKFSFIRQGSASLAGIAAKLSA